MVSHDLRRKEMAKFYITFGQVHVHSVNGKTFDKDSLCEIEATSKREAHELAMDVFGGVFHQCKNEEELESLLPYYPRGVIKLEN